MTRRTIPMPARLGSREQARSILDVLPDDLTNWEVLVDCSATQVSAPSFVDELVKVVLIERNAAHLRLAAAPLRTAAYAQRSARNRGVEGRLAVESPIDGLPASTSAL